MSFFFNGPICRQPWRLSAVGIVVVCAMFTGCDTGPKLGAVSGHVTKGGIPQENLWVKFSPKAGGRPSHARTNNKGDFSIQYMDKAGALVGKHEVVIGSGGEVDDRGNPLSPSVELLRKEVEVQDGGNQFEFTID